MKELNFFVDQTKKLETADGFVTPKELLERLTEELPEFSGSYIDGLIIAYHLATIAKAFKDEYLDRAYAEFLMKHGDEKSTHKGIDITPTEGYYKYDYPEDEHITKYKEELTPLEKKVKALKKSIKTRKDNLVADGKATLVSSTKTLKFSRK